SLKHLLDTYDPTFSELDPEELDKNIYSEETEISQLDESSDEDKRSEDIIVISETAIRERKSMLLQPHENIGRLPKNILPNETVNEVKLFIKSLEEQQSEALAVRKYTRKRADGNITVRYEKDDIILLLSHYSYNRLLAAYNSVHPKKLIKKLPHNSQQPGSWFYQSLLKVHQFGFVDEGIDKYWHCVYTEGKALKGTNEASNPWDEFQLLKKDANPLNINNWDIRELLSRGLPEEKQVQNS
ncbi:5614_t:CDS:2, partial [Racocetra fulgida]